MFSNIFSGNRAVYETISKKSGGARWATNDVTIWRTRVTCWISKDKCMHTPTHLGTHMHASKRALTHTQIYHTYSFCYANAFQYYFLSTLSVLFILKML